MKVPAKTTATKIGATKKATIKDDAPKLQRYLRKVFKAETLKVVPHPKKADMAEVMMGDEFIATLYREEEDGETSFQFQMAILDIDLDGV